MRRARTVEWLKKIVQNFYNHQGPEKIFKKNAHLNAIGLRKYSYLFDVGYNHI